MKKIIKLTMMALLTALAVPASAETSSYLVVEQTNGETVKFALASEPVQTYSGKETTITAGESTLTYSLDGIKEQRFTTENVSTGIKTVNTDDSPATRQQISVNGAEVTGLKSGDRVQVYTIGGRLVKQSVADGEGRAAVSLGTLPQGIYILRTPSKSFKIANN